MEIQPQSMASDSNDPTRRKHRRSPSDEENNNAEAPSKRRKHRHHNHHRNHNRRHHHHRSRKEDKVEDATAEVEIEEKREEERKINENAVVEASTVCVSGAVISGSILGIYYDMEEGEILEEGEDGVEAKKKKELGSDVESGEIEDRGGSLSDHSYMEVGVSQELNKHNSCLASEESLNEEDGKLGVASEFSINRKDDGSVFRKKHNDLGQKRTSRTEHASNGDFVGDFLKDDLTVDQHSWRNDDSNQESFSREKTELLAEGGGKRHRGLSRSPSQGRQRERVRSRSRPKSPDQSRGRSRSHSIFRDCSLPDTPEVFSDAYYSKRQHRSDLDDERLNESSRDNQQASRESLRDKERERYSSYSRYNSRVNRHDSRETRDRDREGSRDVDRDRTRDKEREKTREKERERERARERVREHEKKRERERERDWEREKERQRRREQDRESSRDRNRDRDRGRDSERYFRNSKHDHPDDGYGDQDRFDDYRRRRHDQTSHKDRISESDSEKIDGSKKNMFERENEKSRREENEKEDYQEKIVLQLAEQEEDDLERIKEESRRRRQAILEKYKSQKLQQQPEAKIELTVKEQIEQPSAIVPFVGVVPEATDARNEGPDDYVADPSFSVGKSPPPNGVPTFEKPSDAGGLGAGTPKSERSDDMFCDDIFGESPAGLRKRGKGDGLAIERSGLRDNWDDTEGYYSYRFGEIVDGRYEIIAAHGKGVFSTVVRAKDLKAKSGDPEEVAIKLIRNNETMLKAGMDELVILKKLVGADPEDKRHCVRFLSSFKYRNHLCLVFESLHMNLREVLKKFGRNIGLKLTAVRAYAKQLFIALKHLRNCGVLHCDIKPDNMLVNEAKNVLKLCDFGSAMFAGKNEITPYLVSRFYRAPEIILGLPYDHPMDMWSVGCCLFELYAGKVLFPGPSNNDMLRLHMELKGAFPKKMVRKGAFKDHHFDQDLNFLATEEDPVTKKAVKKVILNVKPKDFGSLILGSPGEDPKILANFKDLLEKIFMLDPDKRMTVSQALSHPFITELWRRCLAWLKAIEVTFIGGDLILGGSVSGMFSVSIDTVSAIRQTVQCFRCLKGNLEKEHALETIGCCSQVNFCNYGVMIAQLLVLSSPGKNGSS